MTEHLGRRLKDVRELRGLSLKAVAEPAGISAAYLQKLERGLVKAPSPHVLYNLSVVLVVPYSHLMQLAGYMVPNDAARADTDAAMNILAHALNSAALTPDELEELARYLSWYRQRKSALTDDEQHA